MSPLRKLVSARSYKAPRSVVFNAVTTAATVASALRGAGATDEVTGWLVASGIGVGWWLLPADVALNTPQPVRDTANKIPEMTNNARFNNPPFFRALRRLVRAQLRTESVPVKASPKQHLSEWTPSGNNAIRQH